MTSIAERLRAGPCTVLTQREAADEIERLHAKAERFGVAYENEVVVTRDLRAEIDRLVAELNKYELAALQARTAQVARHD